MKALLLRLSVGSALLVGVLAAIGHALDVEDPLDRADVILALSGDTGPRTATAVGLWKAGYAPLLLFAGGSEDPRSVASSELMKRDAVRDGVPATRSSSSPARRRRTRTRRASPRSCVRAICGRRSS